jgi:hypothetical protein
MWANNEVHIFYKAPPGHTVDMGSTQHATEMSARGISWGSKGGRCVGITILTPLCADCLEILGSSTSCPVQACTGIALPSTDVRLR